MVTGDRISQKTWYFHRTTVKLSIALAHLHRRVWHLGDEPGCWGGGTEATVLRGCPVNPFTADPVKALHFAILV